MAMKAGGAVAGKSRKFYQAQQAAIGTLNGYIEETMTGQKVVKVFCHENVAEEEFEYLNDDLRGKQIFCSVLWRKDRSWAFKPGQLFPDCDDRWYFYACCRALILRSDCICQLFQTVLQTDQ